MQEAALPDAFAWACTRPCDPQETAFTTPPARHLKRLFSWSPVATSGSNDCTALIRALVSVKSSFEFDWRGKQTTQELEQLKLPGELQIFGPGLSWPGLVIS